MEITEHSYTNFDFMLPEGGKNHVDRKDGRCWCKPELTQVCPICNEEIVEHMVEAVDDSPDGKVFGEVTINLHPACWRCGGSGVVEVYDPAFPIVLTHRGETRVK